MRTWNPGNALNLEYRKLKPETPETRILDDWNPVKVRPSRTLVVEKGNADSRQFSRIFFFNCVAEWVKLQLKRLGKSRCDPRDPVSN